MSDILGGSAQTVPTQQNSSPWEGVQPYLRDVFSQGQALGNRAPFSYTPSPYTIQAQQLTAQKALDPKSLTAQAQGTIGDTISGKYLDPSSNPFLSGSVNDALGLAKSQFAGQYGGAAGSNLSNSGYQEGLARTLGNVATNAYSNAYGQERQRQLGATALAPSLDYANANALSGVGQQQDATALNQYNSPWSNLANYQKAITGSFGGQTSSQTPYFTNPLANALGLGIGGLGLYNGIGGMMGGGGFSPTAAFGGMGDAGALGMAGATLGGTDFASMLAAGVLAL